jgi:cystathionine beta-lyase
MGGEPHPMSATTPSRAELRSNGGLKWTYFEEDVLPAWVAEMDFGLAPAIASALHDAVDRGLTGYPYPSAEEATARAATGFWADRFGWSVDPSWVFAAPDVVEGARRAIVHLTRPGSPVVVHSPVYFPFYSMVERAGRDLIEVRCEPGADGRYSLNLDGIDRALDDGAGSIVLCNPWNPTGRVFSRDELTDLLEVVARHDARVIADEIHAPITYSGFAHTPIATLDPVRSVSVLSASKAWNLPGLKCAQVVLTNERDREVWSSYFTPDKVGVSTFGLVANEAAYSTGGDWFDMVLGRLAANRDLLGELIAAHLPGVRYHAPEGTYLAWLDMSAYGLGDPTAHCLEEARVAFTGGGPFGTGADQFVRFNFACDPDLITEMVERIAISLP